MPSIRQSARPNISGWTQVQNPVSGGAKTPPGAAPDPQKRSAFMAASMPLMASTGDAFARQFYANNGLPQQRILPAKKGSGT
jgi:hypothetical protein